MAEDSIPAYITETGKEDRDLRSGNSTTTSAREIDNVVVKTPTPGSRRWREMTGEQIKRIYSLNVFNNNPIDDNTIYYWDDDSRKIKGLSDRKAGPGAAYFADPGFEELDTIGKKYNLPPDTVKKFFSSFANGVLDPMESVIVKGLTVAGLGKFAAPLLRYEIANIVLNMYQQGEESAAKIQLANSAIFGEALGLIKDSSEYTEGLEFEILMDGLEGAARFSEMSPVMYAEDKALEVPIVRQGVDTIMEPVSEAYDTSKDYLKTGMSSVLGAFGGE
jgi:hypothetical protein